MKNLIALTVAAALTSCATTEQPDWRWNKRNANSQDFNMDTGQCRAQAFSVTGGNLMQVALVFDGCMQGKGWYKAPA